MNNDELKAIGCTSIEELIAEDFGTLGTEERNAFEASCEAFIIGEQWLRHICWKLKRTEEEWIQF